VAWSAPFTAIAGTVWTAAQFNTFVRDNLNETMPAKAVTAGDYFVTESVNQIGTRTPQRAVADNGTDYETTTSTSYDDMESGPAGTTALDGPAITCTTGRMAIVSVGAQLGVTTNAGASCRMSWEVSGESSIGATDQRAVGKVGGTSDTVVIGTYVSLHTNLTPGVNTFTAKYRVSSGTGSFRYRRMWVLPL
jgi:hypothetical protein